jgi:hypothetical protein
MEDNFRTKLSDRGSDRSSVTDIGKIGPRTLGQSEPSMQRLVGLWREGIPADICTQGQ